MSLFWRALPAPGAPAWPAPRLVDIDGQDQHDPYCDRLPKSLYADDHQTAGKYDWDKDSYDRPEDSPAAAEQACASEDNAGDHGQVVVPMGADRRARAPRAT